MLQFLPPSFGDKIRVFVLARPFQPDLMFAFVSGEEKNVL
jgi:hypothetical protein